MEPGFPKSGWIKNSCLSLIPKQMNFIVFSQVFWGLGVTHLGVHHLYHSDRKDQLSESWSKISIQEEDLPSPIYPSHFHVREQAGDGADSGRELGSSPVEIPTFPLLLWTSASPGQEEKRHKSNMFIQKECIHQFIHMNAHACTCVCVCVHITFVSPAWILYHWVIREAHFTLMDSFSWVAKFPHTSYSVLRTTAFSAG